MNSPNTSPTDWIADTGAQPSSSSVVPNERITLPTHHDHLSGMHIIVADDAYDGLDDNEPHLSRMNIRSLLQFLKKSFRRALHLPVPLWI